MAIALGDELNGFKKHDRSVKKVDDIVPTLQALIRQHYPDSLAQ